MGREGEEKAPRVWDGALWARRDVTTAKASFLFLHLQRPGWLESCPGEGREGAAVREQRAALPK